MRNLDPHQLPSLLRRAQEASLSVEARQRLQWILHFIEHHGSTNETCVHFGISRSTLHRWLERFDPANLESLEEGAHTPHAVRQSTVSSDVVRLIRAYREEWPMIGKEKIARLLFEEHGVSLSASSVGRVIERECFYFGATPLHWRKRLEGKGMSAQLAEIETEARIQTSVERPAKPWQNGAFVVGLLLQGLAACLALAALWQVSEKPVRTEASVSGAEILESVDPSFIPLSTDE